MGNECTRVGAGFEFVVLNADVFYSNARNLDITLISS